MNTLLPDPTAVKGAPTTSKCVQLAEIHLDSGTQTRLEISDTTVAAYAERMGEGDKFPPVELFFDGLTYHCADGFHRTLAAIRGEFKDILANIHMGTASDALWFAIGANKTNGIQRTPGDKRKAVELALLKFPDKSQQQIALHVGCAQSYVATVKRDVITTDNVAPSTRVDSKGRKQPTRKTRKPKAGFCVDVQAEVRKETPETQSVSAERDIDSVQDSRDDESAFWEALRNRLLDPKEECLSDALEELQLLNDYLQDVLKAASQEPYDKSLFPALSKLGAPLSRSWRALIKLKKTMSRRKDMKTAQVTKQPAPEDPPRVQTYDEEVAGKLTCDSCDAEFDDDGEAVALYECADCCSRFTRENSADGNSHRCPGCNKFGSKVSDNGCPECGEGELQVKDGKPIGGAA